MNLPLGMTWGLRHSPAEFWLLPGELCERADSILTDGILLRAHYFFSSGETVAHLIICVIKLGKKRDHGSMELSCNPVFQTLFQASSSLHAILFPKFTCCNLASARTRGTPFQPKDCDVPWPAVFCGGLQGLRLPTEFCIFFPYSK